MLFTSSKDTQFGDSNFHISQTENRLVREILKTYERTGNTVFPRVFKKAAEDREFEQRNSLTLEEFEYLMNAAKVRKAATQKFATKPDPAKKQNLLSVVGMVEAFQKISKSFESSSSLYFLTECQTYQLWITMLWVFVLSLNFVSYQLINLMYWFRVQLMLKQWRQQKFLQFPVSSQISLSLQKITFQFNLKAQSSSLKRYNLKITARRCS